MSAAASADSMWGNAKKVYHVAQMQGKRKLAAVLTLSLLQAVMQVAGVASIGTVFAAALQPEQMRSWLARLGLDGLIANYDDRQMGISFAVLMILLTLVSTFLNLFAEYVRAKFAFGIAFTLRKAIFAKLCGQPYQYFTQTNPSLILHNLQTLTEYCAGQVLMPALEGGTKCLVAVLLCIIVLAVDAGFTVVAITGIAIGYAVIFFGTRGVRRQFGRTMQASGQATIRDANLYLQGVKAIRVQNVDRFFALRYLAAARQRASAMAKQPLVYNVPKYGLEALVFVGVAGYLIYLMQRGKDLNEEITSLSVVAVAMYRMMPSIQVAYQSISQVTTNLYVLDDLSQELGNWSQVKESRIPLIDASPIPFCRSLRLERVGFHYPGAAKPTLTEVSLEVPRGASVGISGPSGSGKSTLVDLLLGLYHPNQGGIFVDGKALDASNIEGWRAIVGYVPQDVFLIDDTIRRNVAFGVDDSDIDQGRIEEVCEIAQISGVVEQLPRGYETEIGDRGVRLSGGQRQRLALARALYHRPEVLILDEATALWTTKRKWR